MIVSVRAVASTVRRCKNCNLLRALKSTVAEGSCYIIVGAVASTVNKRVRQNWSYSIPPK